MVDKDTWKKEPKTMNPDGSPKKEQTSGFVGTQKTVASTVIVLGLLGLIAYGIMKRR
jgi:hypothetical protein